MDERLCAWCDGTLPTPKATGRPRVWCSERCRHAGNRRNVHGPLPTYEQLLDEFSTKAWPEDPFA